eukprot:6778423-Prymnesium_polylepis.2
MRQSSKSASTEGRRSDGGSPPRTHTHASDCAPTRALAASCSHMSRTTLRRLPRTCSACGTRGLCHRDTCQQGSLRNPSQPRSSNGKCE